MKLKRISLCLFICLAFSLVASAQEDSTGVRALTGTPQVQETAIPTSQSSTCGLAKYSSTYDTGSYTNTGGTTYTDVLLCQGVAVRPDYCTKYSYSKTCLETKSYCPSGYYFVNLGGTTTTTTYHSGGSSGSGSGSDETRTTTTGSMTCMRFG